MFQSRLQFFLLFILSFYTVVLAQGSDSARTGAWEKEFRSIPSPDTLRSSMKLLSARPHHVGSAYDKQNAEWILAKFKEWGWDAHIETFDVLFPTPKERSLELLSPRRFAATLQESSLEVDPTSSQKNEQLPTYNAYSIDGDVTAPLVYVNYGSPDDYERLERMGISVKDCIVIARYGETWRGIKPKVAAEHGAIGCLIYSDPANDGYTQGDVFPRGAYRPNDGVQRGSVMDMVLYPGDPLTPGVGASDRAKRLSLKEVQTLTKIPVLPISYADAQPLLEALSGPVAPGSWRGTLPMTYHIGPGTAKVHLRVSFNWDRKKIYDVIATLHGTQFPAEWIIRGNHYDAWVNGAEDPISAQVALLEEARAMGDLLKKGWKPKRTIIYCAWDGEEEGLLGSTEWAEEHAEELKRNAVVYINSDANGRGYLGVSGSHSLEKFINDVARDIQDPETKISVGKRLQLQKISFAAADERQELRGQGMWRIGDLGSGSDYTAFLDFLGIASLNVGYGGEDGGGIYHSIYDDFYWYTHFSDTSFVYGCTLAQTVGTAVMRLAGDDLLPIEFTKEAETIKRYIGELQQLLRSKQDEIRERNQEIDEGVYTALSDPKVKMNPPKKEELPPYLNFAPVLNAVDALSESAERYHHASMNISSSANRSFEPVNRKLIESERKLTRKEGLPGRPWFKHQIYAPGFYTGYGVKTIPAVREAIEQKQWKLAEEQISVVAAVLNEEGSIINDAAKELEDIVKK